ncbi:hypothetical protein N7493_006370 [Penicillium malachiteum]|uniref:Uncharacterized protein n=1 Tax=Penicillium malachiteum TaxID=1324776 RepID=A0AAD6HKF3_9EURO|nr:hypothetical protein N7493_006370 [Penicillium malachiteum]
MNFYYEVHLITRRVHFRLMGILQSIPAGARVLTESLNPKHEYDYKPLWGFYEKDFVYSSLGKKNRLIKALVVAMILLLCPPSHISDITIHDYATILLFDLLPRRR